MTKYCPKCQGEIQILGSEEFYVVTNSAQTTYHAECPGCGWRSPECRDVGTVMYSVLSTPRATTIGGDKLREQHGVAQAATLTEYRVARLPVGMDQELELGTVGQVLETVGAASPAKLRDRFRERAAGKLVLRVGEFLTVVDPAELRRILDLVDPQMEG